MKSYWKFEGLGAVFILAAVVGGCAGWVMNIIKIAEAGEFTAMVALRCIGVLVVFLGAILGWIG